ncbi:redoxin domain-containing protein [Sporosarcina sp. Te-1]|uniref:redoxin domain-containing protein n=1 Tax=Sporosarcina sp. Te-1 TaxID=2818390 RepID=UPI001A9EDEF2|nr:redoxin domain-containing protein [Sporosarcina sp. Te-1]QTD41202.1 redoxin domain-containing protein [Sporosarcina sp. Te-1]
MNKKVMGYVIAALVIGSMVVVMIRSNTNDAKPLNDLAVADNVAVAEDGDTGLGQGDIAPDFHLETSDGTVIKLSELKGKKVILNFWASWCPPCKAEMPHMENYYKNFSEDDNVEIVAVNLTSAEKLGLKGVEDFIDSYGLTFPIPLDKEGEVSEQYQVYYMPTTFMIQTDGTIAQKIVGPMDENMIRNLVDSME